MCRQTDTWGSIVGKRSYHRRQFWSAFVTVQVFTRHLTTDVPLACCSGNGGGWKGGKPAEPGSSSLKSSRSPSATAEGALVVTPEVTPDPMAESTGDITPKGLPPLGGPYAAKNNYNTNEGANTKTAAH